MKDNKVSFIIEVDKEYDKNMVHFKKFIDARRKRVSNIITRGLDTSMRIRWCKRLND